MTFPLPKGFSYHIINQMKPMNPLSTRWLSLYLWHHYSSNIVVDLTLSGIIIWHYNLTLFICYDAAFLHTRSVLALKFYTNQRHFLFTIMHSELFSWSRVLQVSSHLLISSLKMVKHSKDKKKSRKYFSSSSSSSVSPDEKRKPLRYLILLISK